MNESKIPDQIGMQSSDRAFFDDEAAYGVETPNENERSIDFHNMRNKAEEAAKKQRDPEQLATSLLQIALDIVTNRNITNPSLRKTYLIQLLSHPMSDEFNFLNSEAKAYLTAAVQRVRTQYK